MFYDALKVRRMASWLVLYLQQCNMDKLRAIKYQLIPNGQHTDKL